MIARMGLRLCALCFVVLLFAAGCAEDSPYYTPESPSVRGPRGSTAFLSGESINQAFSPVRDGKLETPCDGVDEGTDNDEQNGDDETDPDDELDFGAIS